MSGPTLTPASPPPPAPAPSTSPDPSRRAGRAVRAIRPGEAVEALSLFSSACTIIALVCVWMLLQMLVLGAVSEVRAQHLLYSQLRTELAEETAPTGALDYNGKPVTEGSPVALLSIPAIGVKDMVVVDGTSSGDLLSGPGHWRTTPLPGNAGWSEVLGRGTTYGAPFGKITSLRPGDTIEVLGAQGTTTYTVKDVRRAGDTIPPYPTGTSPGRLTLATADGSGFLSRLRPRAAVYVDADTTAAHPSGEVFSSVAPTEAPMARDTSALPMLALLLALLCGVVLAVSFARRRIRAVVVWLVAAPATIALAWAVTDQVMRLLPNLM